MPRGASLGLICLVSACLLGPLASRDVARAQQTSGQGNALNPDTSATVALASGYSSRSDEDEVAGALATGFSLQELELRWSANSDPYFRYDVSLAGHLHDGAMEVAFEEAFLSTLAIPSMTVRAGMFLVNMGKANLQHVHTRRFIDAPRPLTHVLGAEHLRGLGASLDILLPLPFFAEINLQAVHPQWRGEAHGHGEETAPASTDDESEHAEHEIDLAYIGHLKTFFDLNDAVSLEWGVSGLLDEDEAGALQTTLGLDLTLKWVPSGDARYTSLEWLTEYMVANPDEPTRDGLYSGLRYQSGQRWWYQARGALLNLTPGNAGRGVRGEALMAFAPSERTAVRLQYAYEGALEEEHEEEHGGEIHEVFLQLVVSIGSHPAHAY